LQRLAEWLIEQRVEEVVMESTTGISTSRESVRRLVDSAVEAP
jgi:dihydrodipicolinate synthase/N-acetylneuraminate lyase